MVCVRKDGRIAFANARAEDLFGYTQRQLIGAPIEMLMPEVAARTPPGPPQRVLRGPEPTADGRGPPARGAAL